MTKPNEDDVDGRNPLNVIWNEHASDNVRITRWEPTAQRMQPGKSKHKFFEAARDCKTVGELRRVWAQQGRPWRLWKFLFASRWILFTIDTAAARLDYARLKAAIEGLPAPPAPVPISEPAVEVSEDEAEDAPFPLADESNDGAPLPAGEGDEGDEPPPPVDEEDVAEVAPPTLEDEEDEEDDQAVAPSPADDDMEDAEAPAPLFRADDVVFARDGREDHPAIVVENCAAGATIVRIKWRTGRTGEYDWPLSDVMALEDVPRRRPRKEAPAAPRRTKAPVARKQPSPSPRPSRPPQNTFRVGDEVEARYLGDLGSYCPGTVAGVNADGSFVIDFDDCDRDSNVRPCHVIARRPQLPAPVINKRPPPRPRTGPAEKRARPAPPPPPLEESDEELEAPPPAPEEADDEGMPLPPPPDDEGEEDDEEPAIPVKIVASPTGTITVTPPVAAPRVTLEEGDEDDDESFGVGAAVEARFRGDPVWYEGTIVGASANGYEVAYDDGDHEKRVPSHLVRAVYDVSAANDASDLGVGDRCYYRFDEDAHGQDIWMGTIVAKTEYVEGVEFEVVFDDGKVHNIWAHEAARALQPSIRATTLKVDQPNLRAREEIARRRRDGGRKRERVEALDATTLWEPTHKRAPPEKLRSAELGSGKGALSSFLAKDGVLTTTVDWNPDCGADDQRDFLDLPLDYLHPFDIIHISQDCYTYSNLAGGKHRNRANPEGHSAAAKRANSELDHLVAMIDSALTADPTKVVNFENPVGMLQHTKGARKGLEKKCGLTKLEVCYCKFMMRGATDYIKKPTHFWTNCKLLIDAFGDGKFRCSAQTPCSCGDGYHRRVRPEAGQEGDRARDHAAFPDEVARFLALMLINEARARSR